MAQLREEKKLMDAQKEAMMVTNKERKERMANADRMRATRMSGAGETKKTTQQPDNLLSKAMEQMDEEHDEVKHMNQLMLQSKVMTIRDLQVEENKRLEEEWLAEQKRLDLMLEIERLKALRAENEREVRKQEAVKKGAAALIDQIRERDLIRQKEAEILEKEKQQVLMNIEK